MTEIYLEMISFISKEKQHFLRASSLKWKSCRACWHPWNLLSYIFLIIKITYNIYLLVSYMVEGICIFLLWENFITPSACNLTCSWMSTQTTNNCKCIKQILLIRNWKYWWTVFTGYAIKVLGWVTMVSCCIYTM